MTTSETMIALLPVRPENAEAVGYVCTTPEEGYAQLEILKELGCLPHHRVLEIGCGALVAGFPIMQYLDVGGYVGVDPNTWLRRDSKKIPEVSGVISTKRPTFVFREDFLADPEEVDKYDFIISHSILSHTSDEQLDAFFAAVKEQLAPGGKLAASLRLAEGNSYGSPGSSLHGDHFTTWQYPGVSWFTRGEVLTKARKHDLEIEFAPKLTEIITKRGNPKAVHDWIVAVEHRQTRLSPPPSLPDSTPVPPSPNVTFVTAFFNLPDRKVDADRMWGHFYELAGSGLPIILFLDADEVKKRIRLTTFKNVHVIPLSLQDLWPFRQVVTNHRLGLPEHRDAEKDTKDFLLLQHAKLDLLAMAVTDKRSHNSTHLAWIDFAILKISKIPDGFLSRLQNFPPLPRRCVLAPGCWARDQADRFDDVNRVSWRFCGGFLLVDRTCIPQLVEDYHAAFRRQKQLTWEVNLWSQMERQGTHFDWYSADHDDSIIAIERAGVMFNERMRQRGYSVGADNTSAPLQIHSVAQHPIMIGTPCFREDGQLLESAIWAMRDPLAYVVVVDNGSDPECKRILHHHQANGGVEIIVNPENRYVNAAWNQLAERFLVSDAEILVIANADAVLSLNWARELLEAAKSGPALWRGIGVKSPPNDSTVIPTSGHSAGVFFALHRDDVSKCFPIPRELKIWYGDTWIFDTLRALNRREVTIENIRVWHAGGVSSKKTPELAEMVAKEKILWDTYLHAVCQLPPTFSELDRRYEAMRVLTSDINEHLPTLRQLASECGSVTEFGVGRSTFAFAAAKPKTLRCYDPAPDIGRGFNESLIEMARDAGVDARFEQVSDLEIEIEPTDLLFIDTKHTGEQLAAELVRHAYRVNRHIVMHDTEAFGGVGEDGAQGLQWTINTFLEANPLSWRLKEKFTNNNGLTILERVEMKKKRVEKSSLLEFQHAYTATSEAPIKGEIGAKTKRALQKHLGIKRICLNMIVKNEAKIILRCLTSALPFIDTWVIVDTGSTDGTPWLIEGFFREHKIEGRLCKAYFKDFSQARNEALTFARAAPGWDYLLLIDADMELKGDLDKSKLTQLAYLLPQHEGNLTYENTRLLSRSSPAKYLGVTHEYLDTPALETISTLDIVDHSDGGSKGDKGKRDIELLTAGLEKEPNNYRYMFYLANTYREAGEFRRAIDLYRRHIKIAVWDEEIFTSHYSIARCYAALGDAEDANFIKACLDAYAYRPSRGESLKLLANHLRDRGRNELACMFAEELARIPFPGDKLFVDRPTYDYGADVELAIAGFYSPKPDRKQRGYEACARLTTHRTDAIREQAKRNFIHYIKSAAELFQAKICPIDFKPADGWHPMNPSVWTSPDEIGISQQQRLVLVRTVNYTVTSTGQYPTIDNSNIIKTKNYMLEFDADWKVIKSTLIEDVTNTPRNTFPVEGFEDCRLWADGAFHISATVRDLADNPDGKCEMVVATLNGGWQIVDSRPVRNRTQTEKNWMPVIGSPKKFVYLCDPTEVVDVDSGSRAMTCEHVTDAPVYLRHLRGGSQVVPLVGGYLCLTHEVTWIDRTRFYFHRWVKFDPSFKITHISDPFYFQHKGIEFCAGLAWDSPSRLVASFGVNDASAHLAFFDIEKVSQQLHKIA